MGERGTTYGASCVKKSSWPISDTELHVHEDRRFYRSESKSGSCTPKNKQKVIFYRGLGMCNLSAGVLQFYLMHPTSAKVETTAESGHLNLWKSANLCMLRRQEKGILFSFSTMRLKTPSLMCRHFSHLPQISQLTVSSR